VNLAGINGEIQALQDLGGRLGVVNDGAGMKVVDSEQFSHNLSVEAAPYLPLRR
jgi:hypothetical protein